MAQTKREDQIVAEAHKRFDLCVKAEVENRKVAKEDLDFVAGKQWSDEDISDREGRATLTVNKLSAPVQRIVSDIRQSKVSPKAVAGDDASKDTAQVYEGLLRSIDSESRAESIFEDAATSAAGCGLGAIRITNEYASDDSFEQVLRIKPVYDPFGCYWDPGARLYDKSDAKYWFYTDTIPKEEFIELYGENVAQFDATGLGSNWRDLQGENYRRAEYFRKVAKTRKLVLIEDAQGQTAQAFMDELGVTTDELLAAGLTIKATRKVVSYKVERYLIGGQTVLEGPTPVPGGAMTLIPVLGPEVSTSDGKRFNISAIRYAKDPQRLYNYTVSAIAERTALSPKAKWMATVKMVAGREQDYASAHDNNNALLLFTPDTSAPTGKPEQIQPVSIDPGLLQQLAQASDDIKATTGTYDAALGAGGPEVSGVAINARQGETDATTLPWIDNLHRSREAAYRCLAQMIPEVYDTEREITILMGEKSEDKQTVKVNSVQVDPLTGKQNTQNDLTKAKINVVIDVGPLTKTARAEARNEMATIASANPQFSDVLVPLYLDNSDFKDADKAAEAIRAKMQPQTGGPSPQETVALQKQIADLESKQLQITKQMAELQKMGILPTSTTVPQPAPDATQGQIGPMPANMAAPDGLPGQSANGA